MREVKLAGPARLELIRRLDDRWSDLRIFLGVPRADVSRWPKGEEPERLLYWLETRDRLGELRPAFKALQYDDLIPLLLGTERERAAVGQDKIVPEDVEAKELNAIMERIGEATKRLTPDTHPNQVTVQLNEVLDGLDQGRLNKLLGGENTDLKNTVRYVIADALDLIGLASVFVYKYPDRLSAIEKAFAQLEPIFKSDPNWRPKTVPDKVLPGPGFGQPVCVKVFVNRLDYVIAAHAISKSRVRTLRLGQRFVPPSLSPPKRSNTSGFLSASALECGSLSRLLIILTVMLLRRRRRRAGCG